MKESYTCSICGTEHAGLATDWAYALPDDVWAIPEMERAEKAKFDSDLCRYGDRHFIRCVLTVPFTQRPGGFGWGAWAEVDWPTFERYLHLYHKDGSSEPTATGLLANSLPAYPQSLGAHVAIQFRTAADRPSLSSTEPVESPLAREQRGGIDDARFHEILSVIGR